VTVTENVPPLNVVPELFWMYSGRFVPAAQGRSLVCTSAVHIAPPPGVSDHVVAAVLVGN
jgi:hypothetical protein